MTDRSAARPSDDKSTVTSPAAIGGGAAARWPSSPAATLNALSAALWPSAADARASAAPAAAVATARLTSTAARSKERSARATDRVGANASVHGSRASTLAAWGRNTLREAM